jgi:hypothetical protein
MDSRRSATGVASCRPSREKALRKALLYALLGNFRTPND